MTTDMNPENMIRPTCRPSSVRIDRTELQEVTDAGVTTKKAVHFVLLTESGNTEVWWPAEYALDVARFLVQQASGLEIATEMP